MKRLRHGCQCGRLHVHCDGQPFTGIPPARWDAYATVVLEDDTPDGELLAYEGIGDRTSNEAEYSAVIWALKWVQEQPEAPFDFHLITDSDLLVNQVQGDYRCQPHLRPYRDEVRRLLKYHRGSGRTATLTWMSRDVNFAGWHNAGVLLDRARQKRQRDKEAGVVRKVKHKPVPGERRRWAFQK